MNCEKCGKRLTRKTARQVDGVVQCSACMFAKVDGRRMAETEGLGAKPDQRGDAEGGIRPNPLIGKGEVIQADREAFKKLRGMFGPTVEAMVDAGSFDDDCQMLILRDHRLTTQPNTVAAQHEPGCEHARAPVKLCDCPNTVASPGYEAERDEIANMLESWAEDEALTLPQNRVLCANAIIEIIRSKSSYEAGLAEGRREVERLIERFSDAAILKLDIHEDSPVLARICDKLRREFLPTSTVPTNGGDHG